MHLNLHVLKMGRDYHYFCRLKPKNKSACEILYVLDPTQSVYDKICIVMHQLSDFKCLEYLSEGLRWEFIGDT
jgi:hypothetical protein